MESSNIWMGRLLKLGAPSLLVAALTAPFSMAMLTRWEGNIMHVYADSGGLLTACAGRTGLDLPIGTQLTNDRCAEINKATLLEYGYGILSCVRWDKLTQARVVALTIFGINVGIKGACGSQAVKAINAGDIAGGCKLIAWTPSGKPNWSYIDGVFSQGLQNRRIAEYKLCLQDSLPI